MTSFFEADSTSADASYETRSSPSISYPFSAFVVEEVIPVAINLDWCCLRACKDFVSDEGRVEYVYDAI